MTTDLLTGRILTNGTAQAGRCVSKILILFYLTCTHNDKQTKKNQLTCVCICDIGCYKLVFQSQVFKATCFYKAAIKTLKPHKLYVS